MPLLFILFQLFFAFLLNLWNYQGLTLIIIIIIIFFLHTYFILVVFSGMALNIFLLDCYWCYFSLISLGTGGRVAPRTFNYISMSPR